MLEKILSKEDILNKLYLLNIPFLGEKIINNTNYLEFKFPKRIGYIKDLKEYSNPQNIYYIVDKFEYYEGFYAYYWPLKEEQYLVAKYSHNDIYNGYYSTYSFTVNYNIFSNPYLIVRNLLTDSCKLNIEFYNINNKTLSCLIFDFLNYELNKDIIIDFIKDKILNI